MPAPNDRPINAAGPVRPAVGKADGLRAGNRRLERAFLVGLGILVVIYLGMFAHYFMRTMIRRPFWDMYKYVMDYLEYPGSGSFLRYVWSPYSSTEHHQVWMRLLTAFDIEAFHGSAYPFLVVATASVAAVPALIAREVWRTDMSCDFKLTAVLVFVLLVMTTANVVDCSNPIEGIYPQTLFFVVLSIVLFADAGKGGALGRLAGILAGMAAGFACAVGLAIWPILLWMAWRDGLGWKWIVGVALVGAAYVVGYVSGMPASHSTTAFFGEMQFLVPSILLRVADYLLTFLGLPWTRAPALYVPGRIIGAAWLILGVAAILGRGFMKAPSSRLDRIALAMIAFSLITAVAASIARTDEMQDGILPVRYSVFVAPIHLGLLCLALPWLYRCWLDLRHRRVMQGAIAAAGGILLLQQVAVGEAAAFKAQAIRAANERFAAGGDDPEIRSYVFYDLSFARKALDAMQRAGIYQDE